MRHFIIEMGDLGSMHKAETEEAAILQYIDDVCGAKTLEEYEAYCESIGVDAEIKIKEITE